MAVVSQISSSVHNSVPVDQASESTIVDKLSEVLVTALIVWDISSCYELIIDLSQCQLVTLSLILFDDGIDFLDQLKAFCLEIYLFVLNFAQVLNLLP